MEASPQARVGSAPRWVPAAVAVAASLVAWLRLSPTTRATVWAEDGRDFLGDRLREGPLLAWFDPYAGYLHLIPRATADAVVSFLPTEHYALGMTGLSCLVVGGIAAVVFVCSRDVVPWLPARLALAAATVLLPAIPIEVLGNAANVHWAFLWLAPWLLLAEPRTHRGAIGLGAVALVGALTEIQMAFFLPLALHHWSDRRRWWVSGGMLAGLAGQGIATLVAPRGVGISGDWDAPSVAEGYLVNAVTSAWTGSADVVGDLARDRGLAPFLLTVVPFVAAAAYALWRGTRLQRVAAATLAVGSVVAWSAAAILNPWPGLAYPSYSAAQWEGFGPVRYGVVPGLLLAAVVVLALAVARDRGHRAAAWVGLGALAVVAALAVEAPGQARGAGPRWDDELVTARAGCPAEDPERPVALPIAPLGWWIELRCGQLGVG